MEEHADLVAHIVESLGRHESARSASLVTRRDGPPASAGVYSWWADADARATIDQALGTSVPALVYIGKAGGGSSAATLASRIMRNHFGNALGRSTLRRTITAILGVARMQSREGPPSFPAPDEVSAWMRQHLSVATVAIDNRALVGAAERAALLRYDPPLNLDGMRATDARVRLKSLRRTLRAGGTRPVG